MGTAKEVESVLGRDLDILQYLNAVRIVAAKFHFEDFVEAADRAEEEIRRLRKENGRLRP